MPTEDQGPDSGTPCAPLLARGWVSLTCTKCGAAFQIKPSEERHGVALRSLAFVDDEADFEPGVDCPLCMHSRGGHYPLLRVPREGERAAIAAFVQACVTAETATEPMFEARDDPPEDASDAEWDAYTALEDAEDEACRVYDQKQAAVTRAREALEVFGYTALEIDEMGWNATEADDAGR